MADPNCMKSLPLALLCLLVLPGCLELDQTIALAGDGSGTQRVRMVLPLSTVASIRAAGAAAQTGAATDPLALFAKEQVTVELQAAGLQLVEHKPSERADVREVELSASFPSLDALRRSPLSGSAAEWKAEAGPAPGTVKLTLYPQGRAAWEEARRRAETMAETPDPIAAQFLANRRRQLAGLDLALRLELPGRVLRWTRNLQKTGDCCVEARVRQEDLATPQDLVRRLAPRFEVVFVDPKGTFPIDP